MNYENLFNLCFKSSDSLLILLSDNLVVLDINSSAEKVLGWEKNHINNRYIGDIFNIYETTPFISTNLSAKEAVTTTKVTKENTEFTIRWKITPIHSVDNINVVLVSGKLSKQTSNIRPNNTQLDNILKYAPGLVYWKDKNSIYQGCNDEFARLAGLESREQVKGKTDFDLIWKDGAHLYIDSDQKVLETGKPNLNVEEIVATADNKKLTMITNKVPLLDNMNRIIGIMGITTDITNQKKMEEDLKHSKEAAEAADQAKSDFMASMSHDLRTPLTGVIGLSQTLEHTLENPDDKENAHLICASGEQLLNMLNEILDDVRADHMVVNDLSNELFDVYQCLDDLVKLELPTIKNKGLLLNVAIDASVPRCIIGDRKKIHHILLNLVGNAIKFTESGEITINLKCLERKGAKVHLEFCVSDTGIGIPKEHQEKVFDRFFRISPSHKGIYTGHGLGLHIAQSYVNLLGGKIRLTSEEGVGTTFSFDLKCKVGKTPEVIPINPSQPTNVVKNEPMVSDEKSPYLLLVEDNGIALRVLQSTLTAGRCRFESAVDGERALVLAKQHPFDLIITDIGLPGISGNEFARQFREWESSKQRKPTPIVGLTAHARDVAMKECLESGMNDVFTKPMTSEMLNALKKDYLAPKSLNDESNPSLNPAASEGLGLDLPKTEEELFLLEPYPLLDVTLGLEQVNSDKMLLTGILRDFAQKMIPDTLTRIKDAYSLNNWDKVEELAHYLKGSTLYCGTLKMKYACQYLERYRKAGHHNMLDKLYHQLLLVSEETKLALENWLEKNSDH